MNDVPNSDDRIHLHQQCLLSTMMVSDFDLFLEIERSGTELEFLTF